MWAGRVVALVMMAALVSGCAGARTRQELARLQSHLGLLDERITQLEHSSVGVVSAGTFSEPAVSAEAMPDAKTPAKKSAARPTASSAAPLKPTTREIQQALKNAGFYQGTIDGKMGPVTREAVQEFQRVHGLTDDGVVGKRTWERLKAYADLSAGSEELNAAEILK